MKIRVVLSPWREPEDGDNIPADLVLTRKSAQTHVWRKADGTIIPIFIQRYPDSATTWYISGPCREVLWTVVILDRDGNRISSTSLPGMMTYEDAASAVTDELVTRQWRKAIADRASALRLEAERLEELSRTASPDWRIL